MKKKPEETTPSNSKGEEKDRNREVSQAKARFVIILRANSYDTSVIFYENEEDALWAMKNSWFDSREAIIAQLCDWDYHLKTNL